LAGHQGLSGKTRVCSAVRATARQDKEAATFVSGLLEELRASLGATYDIERELGGAGMSRVFVAEEVALGRRIVLKVLPPEMALVISAARFEREVRVAARLQHPHIVPLLAAGLAGEVLFYTMPFVDGESLRERLNRQQELPVAEAARLLRDVADALAYAHREGVVHRDIKPDNILLSHRYAMVTDFGVARALSEAVGNATLTHTGMAVGTPAYMAPEQAAGDTHIDHRADLYALGIVGYEMLAGQPPFRASTFQALVAAQLTQTPVPVAEARPSVSGELAAIVHRCLEKRAADRFQDAAELVGALDGIVPSAGHSPIVFPHAPPRAARPDATRVVGPPESLSSPDQRGISRRAALAGGATMGLLGAAFGAGIFVQRRAQPLPMPAYQRLTFRRGMIRTARFGPDYRTVLYGALWDGDVCRVHAVRPDSPESAALPLPPAAPLAVSTTGELALALGTHYRGIMTYGTLARVPLSGGAPRELQEDVKYADWSPDGTELAIVRRVGSHDQLELPVGTVIAQPDSPNGGFSFPRISPRGDSVAVFELDARSWLTGRVVIVNRSGVKQTVSASYFNVFGLAWHGDDVWFTAADALPLFRNAIHAMNASGDVRIVARMPGNTSLHDIAPDGRMLIARTDDRSGIAVRAPGADVERDLSWLDASVIADLSPDGSRILFTENGVGGGPSQSAYLRGTDGSSAVRLADGRALALSPDGSRAIVRSDAGALHLELIPTGPGEASRLERSGLKLLAARWLADGRNVVVRAQPVTGQPRLYVLDVQGGSTRPLTPEALPVDEIGWWVSPDGESVAVSTGDRLELFPITDGQPRRVPGGSDHMRVVGWIGGGLLLSEDPLAGGSVVRVDPATGRREAWADIQPQDPAGIMNLDLGTLVVTPDGQGYGYSWHRAISDLYLVDSLA
jgi:eukaryotic-like serine/threonine-protein kinase